MWKYNGECRIILKYKGYDLMIPSLQSGENTVRWKEEKYNFCRSVKKATTTDNLTTSWIQIVSRLSQECIVAYKLLHCEQNAAGVNMDFHTNIPVNKIDQMFKSYQTYLCAIDFDLGFLYLVVKNKDAT